MSHHDTEAPELAHYGAAAMGVLSIATAVTTLLNATLSPDGHMWPLALIVHLFVDLAYSVAFGAIAALLGPISLSLAIKYNVLVSAVVVAHTAAFYSMPLPWLASDESFFLIYAAGLAGAAAVSCYAQRRVLMGR